MSPKPNGGEFVRTSSGHRGFLLGEGVSRPSTARDKRDSCIPATPYTTRLHLTYELRREAITTDTCTVTTRLAPAWPCGPSNEPDMARGRAYRREEGAGEGAGCPSLAPVSGGPFPGTQLVNEPTRDDSGMEEREEE